MKKNTSLASCILGQLKKNWQIHGVTGGKHMQAYFRLHTQGVKEFISTSTPAVVGGGCR